jgi:ABC-2 type transport system permease protein
MIFLCGLFFPIEKLPVFLKPISYVLPLTYGADVLHGAVHGGHTMPFSLKYMPVVENAEYFVGH